MVRSGNRSVTHDWSSDAGKNLQWAVFFNECELEVLEVTAGHCITLTYNLFVADEKVPGPMTGMCTFVWSLDGGALGERETAALENSHATYVENSPCLVLLWHTLYQVSVLASSTSNTNHRRVVITLYPT